MDVNTLVDILVFAVHELGGPLEEYAVQMTEWYTYYYPTEMLIACAYVNSKYLF